MVLLVNEGFRILRQGVLQGDLIVRDICSDLRAVSFSFRGPSSQANDFLLEVGKTYSLECVPIRAKVERIRADGLALALALHGRRDYSWEKRSYSS